MSDFDKVFDLFIRYLRRQKFYIVIIYSLFILNFVALLFITTTHISNPIFNERISVIAKFFVILIVSPVLETIIFQYFILKLLNLLFKRQYISWILSSILFGLVHAFSYHYVIFSTFIGLVFGACFITYKESNPIIRTTTLHCLYNTSSILLSTIIYYFH